MSAPWSVYALLGAPLAGLAAAAAVFRPLWPRRTHWPILASCAVATAASWDLAWRVLRGGAWDVPVFSWLVYGSLSADFSLRVDGLSASVLAMVCPVAALIHVYAADYMKDDPSFSRFFLYFHLFFLCMVGLLLSGNYLQMYLFWEGVGAASFLLIGFWYEKDSARAAAWKAFLTNRIGDVGFLLAILLMAVLAGGTGFDRVFASLPAAGAAAPAAALLFWAACAKSAQFPLYVWLPDAMEGPTPVSALMHAATMVTAGVFLMARSWPLLEQAPSVAAVVAGVGAFTAVFAAVLAATRRDLKRILAYSTVSHLGLMMLGLGLGNLLGAVFHLITHGFFKAALFLCAGNVIHATAKPGRTSVDVDETGGLRGALPWTSAAFAVAGLSLAGAPPLAGFFSKDLVLESAFHRGSLFAAAGAAVAFGSAFYIARMFFLTFAGPAPRQKPPAHPHEAGPALLGPVLLLAAGSAAAGLLGTTGVLARMLGLPAEFHLDWSVTAAGLGCAGAGAAAAWYASLRRPDFEWSWRGRRPGLAAALDSDLGVQTVAASAARAAGAAARRLALDWERARWDPWTESLGRACGALGGRLGRLSGGLVNDYLWWMTAAAAGCLAVVLCI